MSDVRSSPERLLRKMRTEKDQEKKKKKGKLKIFLGYAAGTGKTYAMLEMAQELKSQGVDAVAGYIEPHARPATAAMAEGLEQLSFKMMDYKGVKVREFDLDAALLRAPKVILVDELAHTNVPGCRHTKRYQDIEELLEHGINVYTTVNIQHLESLNNVVENITGIQVQERIPDRIFDEAAQVNMVDIEPEELIERMREGKIYGQDQAINALDNFFRKNKLVALREIGLRRMADRVNYLANKEGGDEHVSAGEHILVCISPSPSNAKVIRAAARLAHAFHAEFTALYVETYDLQRMDFKSKKYRDENLKLARSLDAKIVTVFSSNVARQIAEYAKVGQVTKLVLGRTNHRIFFGQTRKTLAASISQYAPSLDIYIIPDYENGGKKKKTVSHSTANYFADVKRIDLIKTLALLAASTLLGIVFRELDLFETNIVMLYLLGVMLTAIYTKGYLCSAISSVLGVLFFNYFFTEPLYSLQAYNREYIVTFAMMLLMGMISSWAMSKLQRQNSENAKRAYRTEILLTNSRRLRRVASKDAVGAELASQIQKLVNLTVIFYTKQNGRLDEPYFFFRKGLNNNIYGELKAQYSNLRERSVAAWVFENGHRAGCTTHTLPDAQAIYLPVMDDENVRAVVGMVLEEKREIGVFQYDIISAILNESAFVIERIERMNGKRKEPV